MVGREAEAVGVLSEVGEPQGLRVHDERAEDPVPLGQITDERMRVVIDPDGDELGQPGAGFVEHAERAVAGIDQPDRRLDDPSEHRQRSRSEPRASTASRSSRRLRGPATSDMASTLRGPSERLDRVSGENAMVTVRVFLLDDHEVVRRGLRELLEAEDDLEVVGEAGTAEEAYARIPATAQTSPCSMSGSPMVTASRCAARSARRIPRSPA